MATRGRPPKAVTNAKKPQVATFETEHEGKTCICCYPKNAFKPLSSFYASTSPLHSDGLVPICKSCIYQKSFDFNSNKLDMDSFLAILRQIDRPFIPSVLKNAYAEFDKVYDPTKVREKVRLEHSYQIVELYFKGLLNNPTYRMYRWNDGETQPPEKVHQPERAKPAGVTPETRMLFGIGFTDDDYLTLQNEYDGWIELCENPDDKSTIEIIKNLCYLRLQIVRGVLSGESNLSPMMSAYTSQLAVANLNPTTKKDAVLNPLGKIYADMMQYSPVEFFKDKSIYKDYSGIEKVVCSDIKRPILNTYFGERIADEQFKVPADDK